MSDHYDNEKPLGSPSSEQHAQLGELPPTTRSHSHLSTQSTATPIPDPQKNVKRLPPMREALKKTVLSGVMLVVVFWVCALWLFGLFYDNSQHAHRLRILVVDFDGASVGSALLSSIARVNGQKTWPTFVVESSNTSSPSEVQQRVFDGEFWGGIYSSPGATNRFEDALASSSAASSYEPMSALYYTGNEVRFNTAWSAFVLAPLNRIVQSSVATFARETVAPLLASGTTYPSESAAVLANPVEASFVNLVPFEFGSRIVYNTIGFVFPSLFQFFFLLAVNGVFTMTGAYRGMSLRQHYKLRIPLGFVWTLVNALCLVGWDLIFKESFYISAKNFFGLLGVMWLNNYITFLFFDCLATFVPPAFFSYPTALWIIISVASVIYPLELANVFYRVHYAVPAHATWAIMITVLSHGGANTLRYNLPILFAWLVLLQGILVLALRKRTRDGRIPPTEQHGRPKGV
ncbi:uncharacterized protein JCM6883_005333 [Sporobolomyces salmoneus]|uniref:uncharacterized protein n=1 Tax=Sporobolomyces salmoneus TaxID=183962 RepID=UPI0031707E56